MMLQCIFRPQSLPGGSALCKAYFQILSRNRSLLRLRKPHFRKKQYWGKNDAGQNETQLSSLTAIKSLAQVRKKLLCSYHLSVCLFLKEVLPS